MWTKPEMVRNWQEQIDIHFGGSKEEALEKFRAWREKKKTCQRCEGEKYVECCPIKLICKEANEDERDNVTGNVDRGRNVEVAKHKTLRTEQIEVRKRASIR